MMTLISAHRGGVGRETELENTRAALEAACELPCEYVEFDVQRLGDGTLLLFHDDFVELRGVKVPLKRVDFATFRANASHFVLYDEALAILQGKKKAHIDFKFFSTRDLQSLAWEVEATKTAIDALGTDDMIVTTLEDSSVRAIRKWSKSEHPTLKVGLSLGRDAADLPRHRRWLLRLSELFPVLRVRRCDANLIVANKTLARLTLARFAKRRRLPLLVWTVDDPKELRFWLAERRAWLVTTNFPVLAAEVRDSLHASMNRGPS